MSTPDRLESIFYAALHKATPEDRAAYLAEACGDDASLRARIEQMLAAQDAGFLDAPANELEATVHFPFAERVGAQIGPYKLLQQIGEGGMGAVFMAEQSRPIERKVALKIIKQGMDTRQVIARFEAERQALALMDHPNIARVFDAGMTESGRPFFVMELVRGVPITDFCDSKRLSLRERLQLFMPVCQAVQHAHQKGIIHRDVKPSNVLVAEFDNHAVPKVIDFGVAKATAQRLTEKTMFTEYGQVVGTIEYMSPEQAKLNQLDVDTRSDIYSLGVLLYELLSGSTPFDRTRLQEAAFDEVLRIIREEEPPTPSTKLGSSQSLPAIAVNRHSEPAHLSKAIRGELDWIVMKCLEKDRTRRYETPSGLAYDIERFLGGEPVHAGPPSATYRLRKLAKKHRVPLIVAAAFALLSILGTAFSTWQAIRAVRAEYEARRNAQAAEISEMAARRSQFQAEQATQSERVALEFVKRRVLAAAGPKGEDGGLGRDVTLREAIEAALPYLETDFPNQPSIEAQLRYTIGNALNNLGESAQAAEQFEKARVIAHREFGPEHYITLRFMSNLAGCYQQLGRNSEALKLSEQTLALRKKVLGPDHAETVGTMVSLANCLVGLGRSSEALQLREETFELLKAKRGSEHPDTLVAMGNLAESYAAVGRKNDALELREKVFVLRKRVLGATHSATLMAMTRLAAEYAGLGRHADAAAMNQQAVVLLNAQLGPQHHLTLSTMRRLAATYTVLGRHEDARNLREQIYRQQKTARGADDPATIHSMKDLAVSFNRLGLRDRYLKLREEILTLERYKLGAEHPQTMASQFALAEARLAAGDVEIALPLLEETLKLQKTKLGAEHRDVGTTLVALASAYRLVGRNDEADEAMDEVTATCLHGGKYAAAFRYNRTERIERFDAVLREIAAQDQDAAATSLDMCVLAEVRLIAGDHPGALRAIRAALARDDKQNYMEKTLGWALLAHGQAEEARQAFLRALGPQRRDDGAFDSATADPDRGTGLAFGTSVCSALLERTLKRAAPITFR